MKIAKNVSGSGGELKELCYNACSMVQCGWSLAGEVSDKEGCSTDKAYMDQT